jgi:hypothetical protein
LTYFVETSQGLQLACSTQTGHYQYNEVWCGFAGVKIVVKAATNLKLCALFVFEKDTICNTATLCKNPLLITTTNTELSPYPYKYTIPTDGSTPPEDKL